MNKSLHTGRYTVEPGQEFRMRDFDPNDTSGFEGKSADEQEESKKLNEKLRALQEMLYAEHESKVLIVLQGIDTAGKDGVIHRVFEGVNPQGVKVRHFGIPTNHKWYRDLVVSRIVMKAMEKMDLHHPKMDKKPSPIVIK